MKFWAVVVGGLARTLDVAVVVVVVVVVLLSGAGVLVVDVVATLGLRPVFFGGCVCPGVVVVEVVAAAGVGERVRSTVGARSLTRRSPLSISGA